MGTVERRQQCAAAASLIMNRVKDFDSARRITAETMGDAAADAAYRAGINHLHTRLLPVCPSCPMRPVINYIEAELF